MILTVNRNHLTAALLCVADSDEVRTYLRGVHFAANGDLVASNGHYLYLGKHESDGSEQAFNIIFMGKPPRKFGKCQIDTDQSVARFFCELIPDKIVAAVAVSIIGDQYTDYTRVTGNINPKACDQVGFSGHYLQIVGKIAEIHNHKFATVGFKLQGDFGAAVAEFKSIHADDAKFFLMPVRL